VKVLEAVEQELLSHTPEMKILLDENFELAAGAILFAMGHNCSSACRESAWAGVKNGQLLSTKQPRLGFLNVLISMDGSLGDAAELSEVAISRRFVLRSVTNPFGRYEAR